MESDADAISRRMSVFPLHCDARSRAGIASSKSLETNGKILRDKAEYKNTGGKGGIMREIPFLLTTTLPPSSLHISAIRFMFIVVRVRWKLNGIADFFNFSVLHMGYSTCCIVMYIC